MLMEGSSLGRLDGEGSFPTEKDIERQFIAAFRAAPGFVAVAASAQNIDRIVSIYRACKQSGRTLLLDLYAAEVLKATKQPSIPVPGKENIAVYVPEYQRRQIKRTERFDLVEAVKPWRIYPEDLQKMGSKAVMLFRPAMTADVERAGLWPDATAIWSQWSGYLEDGAGAAPKADLAKRGVRLDQIHTSGHASIKALKQLSDAIRPESLVPIHTFGGDQYSMFFSNVARRQDGEWWEV